MKLRNKKTGEIDNWCIDKDVIRTCSGSIVYNSLAELNAEWEDVPEEPKYFYCICTEGSINKYEVERYETETWVKHAKSIGNCFESLEEAEQAVEKLKAWKRLKDKGFEFNGFELIEGKIRFVIDLRGLEESDLYKDLILLFGKE